MKKYILLSGLLAIGSMAFAQAEFDALKYSLNDINGSARYVAMSGAFGALGGDMTTLTMNPAGIAVYRSSELSITPNIGVATSNSIFNGIGSNDSKTKLMINNFGYVGSFRTYQESEITNFNFGIAYNKIKDFSRSVYTIGNKSPKSLLDRICTDENNGGSNLYTPAYETWLVNKDINGAASSVLTDNEKVNNFMHMFETGGIGEWDFSLGANYGHFLYLGMTLGVQNVDYEMKTIYGEDFSQGGGLELRNVLATQGSGVNFKAGAIFRPFPQLRLGFAYHSPTFYTMTDVYGVSMKSMGLNDPDTNLPFAEDPYYEPNDGSVDYQMQTPGRLIYSAAYQFGEKGFLSIDWDVVDYRQAKLKDADGVPFDDTNAMIKSDFNAVSNIRLGGEYRVTENVSLRAGTAWYQSPVNSALETDNSYIVTAGTTPQYSIEKDTYYLSCGIGYRTGAYFMDAALQRQMRNEHFYNFYDETADANYSKYAELKTNRTNMVVSMGFKF